MVGMIDLRSDTVTCPDEKMLQAMSAAQVGDSGYGDDPSVDRLECLAAEMTGTEASLFMPSGVMGNLVALMTHCRNGDGVVVGQHAHLYCHEGGGLTACGGLQPYVVDDASGCPSVEALNAVMPDYDVHFPQPRLLCVENTHNGCGGVALEPSVCSALVSRAGELGLAVHLDGARIFNAAVACGVDVADYTSGVDSVQFCLSKALGAPMGSMLCGSASFIERARFYRKRLGGALRQAGYMAAAGIYALTHNVARLQEDHQRAAFLAQFLERQGLLVEHRHGSTNMVYFSMPQRCIDTSLLVDRCRQRGLLFNAAGSNRIRLVTHLHIDDEAVQKAVSIISEEALDQ